MTKRKWQMGALALFLSAAGAAVDARCVAVSGPSRAPLLELYTSEGCNNCPPADRWLSGLRERKPRDVVPLAFHVDYWNKGGWVDRFSQPAWTQRQSRIAAMHHSPTVYTPQFVLDGRDWRAWRGDLPEAGGERAGATLTLRLKPPRHGRLEVNAEARMREHPDGTQVSLALYENNLISRVAAGENAGSLLRHDFVVRRLTGPFPLPESGVLRLREAFVLEADWQPTNLGVAAFIQNAGSGEVYQALRLHLCKKR